MSGEAAKYLDDLLDFQQYLAQCTDRQVQGVWEKESAAGRSNYAALARAEMGKRRLL
ncbi:MAG TPA: hypothetical protein PLN42_06650 [Anaerolineae bacterium]|nr:hypothetical protein [Anaerolineae bacterium]